MSISRLGQVLRQHWRLITILTCTLIGLVAAYSFTRVPGYTASALLEVQAPTDSNGSISLQGTLTARERAVTVTSLGNTAQVATLARRRIGAAPGLESCAFTQVGQSEFLRAACVGTSRRDVALAANAYALVLQGLLEQQRQARISELASLYREQVQTLREQGVPPSSYPTPPIYPNYRELTVIDAARAPTSPVSPQPRRDLAIALVLGLLLNTGLAFALERLQNRAHTPEALGQALGERVLAAVPRLGDGVDERLARPLPRLIASPPRRMVGGKA